MSSHRATTLSSAAFVVVATTTSSVSLLLRCRSIICAMTGFPASGFIIFPGKREDVILPSMVATTFFPSIIAFEALYHYNLHMFGVLLAGISSVFDEIANSVGKKKMSDGLESYYTFGFLTQFFSALFITAIGFF